MDSRGFHTLRPRAATWSTLPSSLWSERDPPGKLGRRPALGWSSHGLGAVYKPYEKFTAPPSILKLFRDDHPKSSIFVGFSRGLGNRRIHISYNIIQVTWLRGIHTRLQKLQRNLDCSRGHHSMTQSHRNCLFNICSGLRVHGRSSITFIASGDARRQQVEICWASNQGAPILSCRAVAFESRLIRMMHSFV